MSLIIKAAHFAKAKHEGQMRKYLVLPYIVHPARVAGRVALLPNATENMIAAAYLHDTLEDTKTTPLELEQAFGPVVAKMVIALTNVSMGSKEPRAVRKQKDLEYLMTTPPEVRQIKLLDRLDNLHEMGDAPDGFRKLYANESLALIRAIGDTEPSLASEIDKLAQMLVQPKCKCGAFGSHDCHIYSKRIQY